MYASTYISLYSFEHGETVPSLLYDFVPIFKAGDSDLENLLEDLRKVTEETAVATTTRNTRRSTHKPSEDLELSRGEFASFIQNVELSDVVHIPSSLTSCEPVNRSRRNSLVSDEDVLMKRNKTNRLLSMPCTGRLRVQRPSSVTAPRSRSHVSNSLKVVLNLSDFCELT